MRAPICSPTPLIFTFLFITHAFLLRLPYFWDEAGYFIPAARDLLLTGSLIPHTTLSNAHPPLVMLWLAFWWKFSAFTPATTANAMLMVAAFALLGLWRLARNVANESVAAATVLCTALYPVFFCQSSMAHLDMMAAAFTLWGLAMYVERRPLATIVFFSLAPLAKETAIVTPMALLAWELLCPVLTRSKPQREAWLPVSHDSQARAVASDLPASAARWFVYHHHRTGFYLGNPEYLRYNLQATLSPLRILLALLIRLWHVFGYLNLFLLTWRAAYAMTQLRCAKPMARFAPASRSMCSSSFRWSCGECGGGISSGRRRLARYMLPVVPLVILVCVSTMRRRLRHWTWWIALPAPLSSYSSSSRRPIAIAPEDTLLYRDYVVLHKHAADELARHPQRSRAHRVAGFRRTHAAVSRLCEAAARRVRIENFSAPEIARAAQATDQFDVALPVSPPSGSRRTRCSERLPSERPFRSASSTITRTLPRSWPRNSGRKNDAYLNRNNEWIALIAIEKIEDARTDSRQARFACETALKPYSRQFLSPAGIISAHPYPYIPWHIHASG